MKYKISFLLLMLLIIRIPVFTVASDDMVLFMKIPLIPIIVETEQVHSVSLTSIKEYYVVSWYDIRLNKIEYYDQGGAGMPNHDSLILDKGFFSYVDIRYNNINMLIDKNNKIRVDNELIDLTVIEKDVIEISVKRHFLIEYLIKVGAL
ncbi:MAG: DUF1850 domain-containing protein [Clostridiales bacterium]|nr:DUF1850 domain-containing protein [Clostridiales bacterium]